MTGALLKGVKTFMTTLITTVPRLLWLTTLQTFLFLLVLPALLKLPLVDWLSVLAWLASLLMFVFSYVNDARSHEPEVY